MIYIQHTKDKWDQDYFTCNARISIYIYAVSNEWFKTQNEQDSSVQNYEGKTRIVGSQVRLKFLLQKHVYIFRNNIILTLLDAKLQSLDSLYDTSHNVN